MLSGYSLRVIESCEPLKIGETVYCIEDCRDRRIIRVWSNRLIFGVNEVIFSYERLRCFKIV